MYYSNMSIIWDVNTDNFGCVMQKEIEDFMARLALTAFFKVAYGIQEIGNAEGKVEKMANPLLSAMTCVAQKLYHGIESVPSKLMNASASAASAIGFGGQQKPAQGGNQHSH
jgi:hypothetical protein